ncbi:MAG: T9SS type A sorting domain-containing protein [Bacteroidia bacterium]
MRFENNPGTPLSFSLYNTSNFGQNWTESTFRGEIPGNNVPAGGGDPVVVYESNGKVHFVWLLLTFNAGTQQGEIGIYHASSSDNGFIWNKPSYPVYSGQLGVDPNTNQVFAVDRYVDKPWLAVDRSSGTSKDALYIAFYSLDLQPDTVPTIQVLRKTKNAGTFSSSPVQVNSQTYQDLQFASIDVGPDGVVHVAFWGSQNGEDYALYHAKSENSGASFLPETPIAGIAFPQPDSTGGFPPSNLPGVKRLYPCPQLKVDKTDGPRSGNLYLAWTAYGVSSQVSQGYDIYFSRSTDGGDSWSNPVIVNDDNNPDTHQFFPSLDVSPKGLLVLTWYDRRNDPQNIQTEYFMTWSVDGGLTFSDQFAVSDQASDFGKIGDNNEGFGVGEYTQVVTTAHQAIPFWADGRENNGRVRVYTGFVPLTEEPVVGIREWQTINPDFSLEMIYPNPAKEKMHIAWSQKRKMMIGGGVFDFWGKEMIHFAEKEFLPGNHRMEIRVSGLSAGIYLLKVLADGEIFVQRLKF